MANQYAITTGKIANESLRLLENNLVFAKGVRRKYDSEFGKKGAQIGDTVNVKKPARYRGREGRVMNVEDHARPTVPVQLTTQFGVDVQFTSADLALQLGEFSEEFLMPAISKIASRIDLDGLKLAMDVANSVGTPGTPPTSLGTYLGAGALLSEEAAPVDGLRTNIVGPRTEAAFIDANKNLFNPTSELAQQYKTGNMGIAGGFKWSMTQNLPSHTIGPQGGTPRVNGASQAGSSLITDGWTAAAANRLKKGDVFTIGGVYAVNPQTYESTGQLRYFLVTADVDSDASGNAVIPIYPAIDVASARQNVTNVPADNANINVLGAAGTVSPQGLAFHRDAFTLVSADLDVPNGMDMAKRISSSRAGLSMRFIRGYDITNDVWPCRFDVLYGWKALYPELAVRVWG